MKERGLLPKTRSVSGEALVAARDYLQGILVTDVWPDYERFYKRQPEGVSDDAWRAMRVEDCAEFQREHQRRAQNPGPDLRTIKTGIPALDRALPWVTYGAPIQEDGSGTETQTGGIRDAFLLVSRMITLHDNARTGLPTDFAIRIRKVEEAQKHLQKAAALFQAIPGGDHLADLCSDLVMGAALARAADVHVRPFDPEVGAIGDAKRIRLTCFAHHEKTPLSTLLWFAKTGGRAGRDARAAANGSAVHTLRDFIRTGAPQRATIIAGLCQYIGFPVQAQAVARILDPAKAKPASTVPVPFSKLTNLLSKKW